MRHRLRDVVRRVARCRCHGDRERGQAMTETLVMLPLLLFLIAAVLQIFLIDNQIFTLMSRGERQMLAEAFRQNSPRVGYAVRRVALPARDHQVPVVRFFGIWGGQALNRASLRIRNRTPDLRGSGKRLSIGAGTRASLVP